MTCIEREASWKSGVEFTCHVSLVIFNLEEFLRFSLIFMTLILLKITGQLFCRLSFNMNLSEVSSWIDWGSVFGAAVIPGVVWWSCCILSDDKYMISVFLLLMMFTLIIWWSVTLHHCKVTLFSFVIMFWEGILKLRLSYIFISRNWDLFLLFSRL